jgi:transcriptional regulator of arginine metabolism
MSKAQRHQMILELVRAGGIANQDQLRDRLLEHGHEVNQSTLSRDLRELGLVKGARGYQLPATDAAAAPVPTRRLPKAIASFLLNAIPAQNLVVLKTAPGHAAALAVVLDREPVAGILASLAGDDTILVITPDPATAAAVAAALLAMTGTPKETPR